MPFSGNHRSEPRYNLNRTPVHQRAANKKQTRIQRFLFVFIFIFFHCSRLSFRVKETFRDADTVLETNTEHVYKTQGRLYILMNGVWSNVYMSSVSLWRRLYFCNHLLEQQHQSQSLKESEQIDEEGWWCAAECSVLPRGDEEEEEASQHNGWCCTPSAHFTHELKE